MDFQDCPPCQGQSCIFLNRLFSVTLATQFSCVCSSTWRGGVVGQHYLDLYMPAERSESTTLQELLRKHFMPSLTQVTCTACGANSADSTSCSILLDASSLLALRVRRWDPSQHGTAGLKDSRIVRFTIGETVTVEKQPGEQLKYKVKAAVIHHGASALSGHYTAVVGVNNRTYLADDDYTNTITLSDEEYSQCYMFFLSKV
ncbi:uncharacterized protein LOC144916094 [Branchiostoma floridae x Branchiostoma belcheri]